MKKLAFMLLLALFLPLSACSEKNSAPLVVDQNHPLSQEGLAPYVFSEESKKLIDLLDLRSDVAMICYKAPKEARVFSINSHILQDDGTWVSTEAGSLYLDEDDLIDQSFAGTIAIHFQEDDTVDFSINDKGDGYSTTIPALYMNHAPWAGAASFWTLLRNWNWIETFPSP